MPPERRESGVRTDALRCSHCCCARVRRQRAATQKSRDRQRCLCRRRCARCVATSTLRLCTRRAPFAPRAPFEQGCAPLSAGPPVLRVARGATRRCTGKPALAFQLPPVRAPPSREPCLGHTTRQPQPSGRHLRRERSSGGACGRLRRHKSTHHVQQRTPLRAARRGRHTVPRGDRRPRRLRKFQTRYEYHPRRR